MAKKEDEGYKEGDGAEAFHDAAVAESRRLQKEDAKEDKPAEQEGVFLRGDGSRAEEIPVEKVLKEDPNADR